MSAEGKAIWSPREDGPVGSAGLFDEPEQQAPHLEPLAALVFRGAKALYEESTGHIPNRPPFHHLHGAFQSVYRKRALAVLVAAFPQLGEAGAVGPDVERVKMRELRDRALRAAVKARDRDCCRYCGGSVFWNPKHLRAGVLDHVDPDQAVGLENLVVACRPCSMAKGNRTPADAGMILRAIEVGQS